MSDPSSDESGELSSLLDIINDAENQLKDLKIEVIKAGDNEALAASTILQVGGKVQELNNTLHLLIQASEQSALDVWNSIEGHLGTNNAWVNQNLLAEFWDCLHRRLKDLGKVDIDFRRRCLSNICEDNNNTLLYEICKLNPPVEVVKTLIDITPPNQKGINHQARDSNGMGPLHMVATHGGSLNLA